ncbi:hypothetical protein BTO28_02445, partial [Domibacillus epiphyticus]
GISIESLIQNVDVFNDFVQFSKINFCALSFMTAKQSYHLSILKSIYFIENIFLIKYSNEIKSLNRHQIRNVELLIYHVIQLKVNFI